MSTEFWEVHRGRNVTEVKISTYEPYITVELHQKWARIYVSSSSSLASGLFHKIDLILCKCERKPRFLYQYWWVWGCSVVITNIFLLPPMKPYSDLSVWAYALVSSWIIYAVFINLWRFSLIHSIYHEDSPSFIRRNIDAIVISVVSALIGAVVGVVVTKIIDRVLPNSPTSSTASQQPSNQPNKFKD